MSETGEDFISGYYVADRDGTPDEKAEIANLLGILLDEDRRLEGMTVDSLAGTEDMDHGPAEIVQEIQQNVVNTAKGIANLGLWAVNGVFGKINRIVPGRTEDV